MKLKFNPAAVLASLWALAMLAPLASAHGEGFTFEEANGEYFVDIGASESTFKANEQVSFDFSLFTKANPNQLADYDNVSVEISSQDKVLFAGALHRRGDETRMDIAFPREGEYRVTASYRNGENALAKTEFPVRVGGFENRLSVRDIGIIAIAIVVILAISRIQKKGQNGPAPAAQ